MIINDHQPPGLAFVSAKRSREEVVYLVKGSTVRDEVFVIAPSPRG
jgi:hypothetical protein